MANSITKLGYLSGRRFSPASDEGETVDVLGFVVFSLSETFFSGKEVVDFGLRLVVRGLCTPFAVLRTSAGSVIRVDISSKRATSPSNFSNMVLLSAIL